jgi:hypothetical protein
MTDLAPERLSFHARHRGESAGSLIALYGPRLPEITEYAMTGTKGPHKGSLASLEARLARTEDVVGMTMQGPGDLWIVLREIDDDDTWDVQISRGYTGVSKDGLASLVAIARDAPGFGGLQSAAVERQPSSLASFVPLPPIAEANHAVLVTDDQVSAAYGDPRVFWKMWNVEPAGRWKLCTRALDDIDEDRWLASTFESTMALVRAAAPHLTRYGVPHWEPEMAPWWEFGDLNDEKAGYPALAPGGYDAATRTYDLIGFITKTPLEKGGDEPRRVLVREIYDVRDLVQSKRDPAGRPVETVRITFLEEWMARQERRPLLDAGARVFGGTTEITD